MAVDEDLPEVSLADLEVDERIIQHLRSEWGIEELFPPQRQALPYALAGHNLMLTIPAFPVKISLQMSILVLPLAFH